MHMYITWLFAIIRMKLKLYPILLYVHLLCYVNKHISEALGECIIKVYVSGMLLNYTWNKDIVFKLIYNFTQSYIL